MEPNIVRPYDPRSHVNEEPRNDFFDLIGGFVGMFVLMTVIFFGMVIIKFLMT
ncbi:YqzM family protein [Neobacillus mesonae]|nr:YqzM family protein [Neobacillus mesonae]